MYLLSLIAAVNMEETPYFRHYPAALNATREGVCVCVCGHESPLCAVEAREFFFAQEQRRTVISLI